MCGRVKTSRGKRLKVLVRTGRWAEKVLELMVSSIMTSVAMVAVEKRRERGGRAEWDKLLYHA